MTTKIDGQEYVSLEELKDEALEEILKVVDEATAKHPEFEKVDAVFEICTLVLAGMADHNKMVKELTNTVKKLNNQCKNLEIRLAVLEGVVLPALKDMKCAGNC